MSKEQTINYNVTIKEKQGTCNTSLFEKMVENGDLTATKLSELLNTNVTITGYALCEIQTEDKQFNMNYFDTKEYGLISSGSDIFAESVVYYFGEVESVRLVEVKTKKGKTYKAVPILNSEQSTKKETPNTNEETTSDDLPF